MSVGKVVLIGAGPGPADLLTLRGWRALRQVDVIICDYLVPADVLAATASEVVRLERGPNRLTQQQINELMVAYARAGNVVARLKSGDPLVFGHLQEELAALTDEGIVWEVIPGISAAAAGCAAAGLPVTRRGTGRSFAIVTAQCDDASDDRPLPRADSLIAFMGVGVLAEFVDRLLADGWLAETAVMMLERTWQPWARRVAGTLSDIVQRAEEAAVQPPAIMIVGQAAVPPEFAHGRPTILFTGLDPTNFLAMGHILHWPAIQVVREQTDRSATAEAIDALQQGCVDVAVFTSRVGASSFFAELHSLGLDSRLLAGATIVAAGAGTAMRLAEFGLRADVVPSDPGSRAILASTTISGGCCVLLVQGNHAPGDLQQAIEQRGARVVRAAAHSVVEHPDLGRPLPAHDVIYFVSPSGVRAWWGAYGEAGFQRPAWCMGDVTGEALRELGIEAQVVQPYVSTDQNEARPAH
ncbi:MAG: uroporphyrinogen-III C-methyltransferase [Planctomycetota bacterium]|jgi:uroporphyrinogen III methyltransferase/synthase